MDFLGLGAHCDVCHQKDFLPFACKACGGTFCLAHRADHQCAAADAPDAHRRLVPCPACRDTVVVKPYEDADAVLALHMSRPACAQAAAQHAHAAAGALTAKQAKNQRRPKCRHKGCKKRCLTRLNCRHCNRNYCFAHLKQEVHACEAILRRRRQKAAAARPAVVAVAKTPAPETDRRALAAAAAEQRRRMTIPHARSTAHEDQQSKAIKAKAVTVKA